MNAYEMEIEVLADSEHALARDVIRWRTLALAVQAENGMLYAAIDKIRASEQRKTDEYNHLLHTTKGTMRSDEHLALCRKHRDLLIEVEDLRLIADECRELRSKLARIAA